MGQIEKALERARSRQPATTADELLASPALSAESIAIEPARTLDFGSLQRIELDAKALRERHVIVGSERTAAAASFKMLRTRVRRSMEAQKLTTLAISSTSAHEGKTLISVNLAFRMAADAGCEVILADFDLRRPSISTLLGVDPNLPGLREVLSEEASLEEACLRPGLQRLAVLPNSCVFENSSEVLRSDEMAELVAALRGSGTARTVIFDLPPLLAADDFLAFSAHVDGLLLVVCEGKTLRSDLAETFDHLAGINVIGTVLNRSLGRSETYY